MAVKSRPEAQLAVNTLIVPTVTDTIHRTLLNDNILNSLPFRKDIIDSETPSLGVVVIDFADKDLATVTTAANISISFSNLENGDIKYLALTKQVANTVTFTGATDTSMRRDLIDASVTYVLYKVTSKNSAIYVESVNIDNDLIEIFADVKQKTATFSGWNMTTTENIVVSFPTGVTIYNLISFQVTVNTIGVIPRLPLNFDGDIFYDTKTGNGGYCYAGAPGAYLFRGGASSVFNQTNFLIASGIITFKYF